MDPLAVALVCLLALLVLISLEMPIALAIAGSGGMGILLLDGATNATHTVGSLAYASTAKYALVVIPMYILLGCLISNVGIGERIYSAVNRVVGRLPGGLAATAVMATALFSGISGSSAADVATFGKISVNEMSKHGYTKAYAAAVVAAAGAFAALIPPAIALVLYAIIAEQSIGAMIIAGVIPGVLSCLTLATAVVITAMVRQRSAAAAAVVTADVGASGNATAGGSTGSSVDEPEDETETSPIVGASVGKDLLGLAYAVILFAIVIGGLYAGVFTATEAGAVGAFSALVIALIAQRHQDVPLKRLLADSVRETVETTSMIFLLLVGGSLFAYMMALSGVPREVANWVTALAVPPTVIMGVALLLLLPLGMFLDGLSIMLLTVPILAPLALELGFSGIWFGVMVLKFIEIGLITPPVGLNAFIIAGVTGTRVESVFRALIPFVLLDLAVTACLFAFPEIVLWLPQQSNAL